MTARSSSLLFRFLSFSFVFFRFLSLSFVFFRFLSLSFVFFRFKERKVRFLSLLLWMGNGGGCAGWIGGSGRCMFFLVFVNVCFV